MSRVLKTIKNAKISVFFYALSIFINFFSRKIFLDYLGDDFIGLTSTLQGILSFLNLAELGIGTAVGFALYKPIFNNDHKEINKILSLFGFLYKRIGLIILILGIIVSCFFPIIFEDVPFSFGIIYFIFFSYLTSSMLGYFINYHLFLLEADQKGYIVATYFQTFSFFRLIFQSILVFYFKSYFLWILLELIFSIAHSIFLRKKIKKEYPWLILNHKTDNSILKEFPEIITKIKQIFVHKISTFVLTGTDQLLVFAFVNLQSVAFFGNYQLIFTKLSGLLNNFFAGTGAGIGNLVAENDPKIIKKVFWEMMALRYFIAGLMCICLYYLIEPFIILWLGEKYLLDNVILIVMLINLFILQIRVPVDNFKQAYGLFADTWAPIAETVLNLLISIVLGKILGILGIMLGTLISLSLIVLIWKPYYLYKNGFKKNVLSYWMGFTKLLFAFVLSFVIFNKLVLAFISNSVSNYWDWLILAIKVSTSLSLIYFFILYIVSEGFRNFVSRMKVLILKK